MALVTEFHSSFLSSYGHFRSRCVPAWHAIGLATNELILRELCATEGYRIRWEYDPDVDLSWAEDEDRARMERELQEGSLECLGVILERCIADEWEVVDALWGILLYVKDQEREKRLYEAECLTPFHEE